MVLYMISASSGEVSGTVMATLELGIALLTGGNQMVQKVKKQHLKKFATCSPTIIFSLHLEFKKIFGCLF